MAPTAEYDMWGPSILVSRRGGGYRSTPSFQVTNVVRTVIITSRRIKIIGLDTRLILLKETGLDPTGLSMDKICCSDSNCSNEGATKSFEVCTTVDV
ncbi:hypothetical protein TNIN_362281 [Trichonephila inaurata madagascariensis]|uniref:Uncharacterized protein n=1 Tax=Trichonephila inaurata madagascariensis TaxID=2747483 RepID=A0A8X6XGZ8_9ARAC|nr:hypothetical protein TNIN_362281 [Trichonephila inaurata madagascariensis]